MWQYPRIIPLIHLLLHYEKKLCGERMYSCTGHSRGCHFFVTF
jgi:hypothetical protein